MDVGRWLDAHASARIISPEQVGRELPQHNGTDLAVALAEFAADGDLRPVFVVLTPSGVVADGVFEDVMQIPPQMQDRWERPFLTAEADVVPMFAFSSQR